MNIILVSFNESSTVTESAEFLTYIDVNVSATTMAYFIEGILLKDIYVNVTLIHTAVFRIVFIAILWRTKNSVDINGLSAYAV